MHSLLGSTGLLLLFVATLEAQQQPRSFETWNVHAAALPSPPSIAPLRVSSVHVSRRDYSYEGLALGGIAFGALGAWVGSQVAEACPTEPGVDCSADRLGNALAVGLVGAAVGGGLGYLVGRLSSNPILRRPAAPHLRCGVDLCGRGPEGLQLMRKSLGGQTKFIHGRFSAVSVPFSEY